LESEEEEEVDDTWYPKKTMKMLFAINGLEEGGAVDDNTQGGR
jgi:hypothetical protein